MYACMEQYKSYPNTPVITYDTVDAEDLLNKNNTGGYFSSSKTKLPGL